MSIGQTFPDVLYLGDELFRVITEGGFSWIHHNTKMGRDIPRLLKIRGDEVPYEMKEDGLVVRWPKSGPWAYKERIPEWRKQYPKWEGEISSSDLRDIALYRPFSVEVDKEDSS